MLPVEANCSLCHSTSLFKGQARSPRTDIRAAMITGADPVPDYRTLRRSPLESIHCLVGRRGPTVRGSLCTNG